jgi:purine-binding chemotaxis protein CheW
MRALLVPLRDIRVAVDIEVAVELAARPRLTALPTAPPVVLGVFNRRSDLLPVLDTALLLGLPALGATLANYLLVVQCGVSEVALAATGAPTVVELAEAIEPPRTPGVVGTYRVADVPIALIEPVELVTHAGLGAAGETR